MPVDDRRGFVGHDPVDGHLEVRESANVSRKKARIGMAALYLADRGEVTGIAWRPGKDPGDAVGVLADIGIESRARNSAEVRMAADVIRLLSLPGEGASGSEFSMGGLAREPLAFDVGVGNAPGEPLRVVPDP